MRRAQQVRTPFVPRVMHAARAIRAAAVATTTAATLAAMSFAVAASFLAPRRAAAQTVVIDSVRPKANTVYGDLDPTTPGVQFNWCIADSIGLFNSADSFTQTGFLDWFGYVPDNTAYPTYTETRVDAGTVETVPAPCLDSQVGNVATLPKGVYSFHAIAQLDEQAGANTLTALDTAIIDSVYLYPSPAHIAFANPYTDVPLTQDTIYTSSSAPRMTIATDLGPAQGIVVSGFYTPFDSTTPTAGIFPTTAYTDSTSMAPVYGEFGFYDGDGIYTIIATSDSVPGTFAPARDTMVYIYTSAGLNMQVLQPDSGGVYPTAFEVYGKVAPGTIVRLSCGCTESGDSTIAASDSTWSLGTVHFDTAGLYIYWHEPTSPFGGYLKIPFTFSANQPPTATITQPSKDTTVIVGDTVTFSGTGTDPDGTIAGYMWDFGDGTQDTSATATHAYSAAGVDTVLFRVADNVGATSPADTVIVTVVPNQPPTATITSPSQDTTVFVGDTITFAGTGTDPDDSVVSYLWDLGGGNETLGQTVRYAYPAAGVDTVLLRVTDSRGATSVPDTVIVTVVANQPPTATITVPSQDTTVAGGDTITFSGTGTDPDGTVVGYAWTFGDGGQATGATTTHVFTSGGTFTVTLVTTDDRGATSPPDSVHVTVVTVNRPPTITITEPSQDTTVSAGDTIRFAAAASDPDGDSTTIQWLVRDTTRTGPTTSVVYHIAGTDTVQARAIDSNGAMSAWAVRVLTVVGRGPNVDRTSPGSALRVDGHDVVFVIRAMTTQNLLADVNGDGVVNEADLQAVLDAFGTIPPDPAQEPR